MSIKVESDGTYTVSYSKRHPVTRKPMSLRRIGIKSKGEARSVYDALVIKLNDKIKQKATPSWTETVERYLEDCRNRGLAESTVYSSEKCLQAHTITSWGDRFIDSITTQEVRELLQINLEKKTTTHQKYVLNCIRAVFRFSHECGHINRNPAPMMKFKVPDKIHSVLNEEQAKTLLLKAQELEWEWYPHYAVALYTGMRSGELFALTWDKIDFEKRIIKVDRSWNNKAGYKDTKSGDDRLVEISPSLMPLLKELRLEFGAISEFVLPRNERWDRGQQAQDLRTFLRSIGLPEIRFHDLRATWATMLLGKNVPPAVVMKMGGWKDMDTMMIYMRKAGLDIRGATDCLSGLHTHGTTQAQVLDFRSL